MQNTIYIYRLCSDVDVRKIFLGRALHVYTYIYIYIHSEREREREKQICVLRRQVLPEVQKFCQRFCPLPGLPTGSKVEGPSTQNMMALGSTSPFRYGIRDLTPLHLGTWTQRYGIWDPTPLYLSTWTQWYGIWHKNTHLPLGTWTL